MKKLLYEVITGNAGVIALVPAARFVERGTLQDTDPLQRPFMTYTLTTTVRTPHGSGSTFCEVWAYDDRGSYELINAVLRAVRAALAAAGERTRTRADGSTVKLVEALWQGEGPELFDELLQTSARSATWQLIGAGQ